jgi:protein-disulfide isomerase
LKKQDNTVNLVQAIKNFKGVIVKNPQIVFLVIIIALALVFGGYLLAPQGTNPGAKSSPQAQGQQPVDPALLNNESSPRIGPENAKAKVVVFSDYLCPYCKQAHDIISSILAKYPDDVSLTQRNFIIHDTSIILAKAAEAANIQGKYKEMNDALFSKTVETTEDAVVTLAKELGLDIDKFKSDLNSDAVKNKIEKDNSDAQAMGLGGTPSVFLNNSAVDNFNDLESQVNQVLGK